MKWKVKNCKECFEYQNNEFFRKNYGSFCPWHEDKEDQPPGIIKKIKKERKSLKKWRILLWTPILILGACFFYLLFSLPRYYSAWQSGSECSHYFMYGSGTMIKSGVYLLLLGWMLYNEEKYAKKELKELQDKKNEWIRVENKENEPKNHKTIEKLGQEAEDVRAENRKLDLSYIDFYQKEMNKQEPEATKQRKDIKTDGKINGKTIEEVLGKDWKKRFESLSGEDIIKERDRLKRLIDAEKIKETLKENERKKD